jgi:hypothetical protein
VRIEQDEQALRLCHGSGPGAASTHWSVDSA